MPPKPATTAAMTPTRASSRIAHVVCQREAPSACTCKRRAGSTPCTAAMVKPATSGKAMITWATIIASGVKRRGIHGRFRLPNTPERESMR